MSQSVLVIDDSSDVHDLLGVRLKPEGVQLHRALSGEEGVELASELRPDLILLDIDLPNLTGFEVCRRLKTSVATASIPIIFLTGAAEVHDKVQGFDLGAVDYVTKPFEPAELRARVRAALRTKRYQDLLATRANLDGLTGLWNRAYFGLRFEEEMAAARRYGRSVSLLLFDLDHFKRFNDDYGHPFGDLVLQRTGEVLLSLLRVTDTPCRYGGEEFAVILTETDLAGAVRTAERVQEALRWINLPQKMGADVRVTASFGVSCTSLFGEPRALSSGLMLELADQALYRAKQAGRDRVCAAEAPR